MTGPLGAPTAERHALLRQAADWRLLSLLFECPREGWHRQVAAAWRTTGRRRE